MRNLSRASRAALLGAAALACSAGIGVAQDPAALNGARLVYSTGGDSDLVITDLVNPAVALTTGPERDLAPDWSPDGNLIVFQRNNPAGTNADLWVIAPDGSGLRQLTTGPAFDRNPAWSPDNTRIVFSRRKGNDSSDLWVINVDGSGLRQLTKTWWGESAPTWSPDGTKIAYSKVSGSRPDSDIWTMNANGKNQKALVATRALEGEPNYTPDGSRILFSRESGVIPKKPAPISSPIRYNTDIWSVPAAGGGKIRLTFRKGDDYGPKVSPDGSRYLYEQEIGCPGPRCNTEVFVGFLDGVTPTAAITNRSGTDWGADWGPAAPAPAPAPAPTA